MNIFKNPLWQFVILLVIFGAGAWFHNMRTEVEVWGLVILVAGIITHYALQRWTKKKSHQLPNVLISLLILWLLIYPKGMDGLSILWAALAAIWVVGAKYEPKYKGQGIFNPVALGLIVVVLCFEIFYRGVPNPTFISWWGTSFGLASLILVVPLVLYAAKKFRKYYLVGTFLVLHAFWLWYKGGMANVEAVFADSTVYFWAGVMMIDPKTSPLKKHLQMMAGAAAVLVYNVGITFGFIVPELLAIIAVNIIHLLGRMKILK